ncbi:MAG: hypothetical protein Q3997_07615 [Propionibacteriaceae bacterium]|nr:hypothetical protein [Propionibacteriaceae bacterium]
MTRARVIAPLVGLALAAGCSMPDPSLAVNVGGTDISESTISRIAEGCGPLLQRTPNLIREEVVMMMTQATLADQVISSNSLEVTQTEVDEAISRGPMAPLRENPDCKTLVDAVGRLSVLIESVGEEQFLSAAGAIPVKLNPRYGEWSPAVLSSTGSGSLSAPLKKR